MRLSAPCKRSVGGGVAGRLLCRVRVLPALRRLQFLDESACECDYAAACRRIACSKTFSGLFLISSWNRVNVAPPGYPV